MIAVWPMLRDFMMGDGLSPHGFCLTWQPDLLAWTIMGDGMVALAYAIIPALLLMELGRRRLPLPAWTLCLFGAFILLCGVSHLLMIWTLFHPAYWLEASEKVLTGIVSLFTAVTLPFARPLGGRLRHDGHDERAQDEPRR